ncbi:MAG TPA: M20 family metallopeptidase [Acidimicrobiales bacterium]|nr:M20 family metallopeptidase [Acidimicrobiales bacterium]
MSYIVDNLGGDGGSGIVDSGLLGDAGKILSDAVSVRRRIHSHPETGLELPRTQALILEELESIGLAAETGTRVSSVVGVIEGDLPGPTTLLRADMDALEMPEDTELPFASEIDGRMHACGHDAHVAMLLGATRLLQDRRKDLRGRVVLMFQPGEEGHGGAKVMIDEGLLTEHGKVDRAFAIHISSVVPSGFVTCRRGTILASSDEFRITVSGAGGHASMPHDARDPVPVACEIVTALQAMVTRRVPAFDPAVVTVTKLQAGTAFNVIPEKVECEGTVRAVSDGTRELVIGLVKQVSENVAAAHGCTATVEMVELNYPVTVNDREAADRTLSVARSLIGDRAVPMPSPAMGAEDFSYVLQAVPGAMAILGAWPPGVEHPAPNHSNRMIIDEPAMATGIALYAGMALD